MIAPPETSAADDVLAVSGVTMRFGGVTALSDVSFAVGRGQLLGLIGPNGAGKTTMMRSITGIVRPQTGKVVLNGEAIDGLPIHARMRSGLALSQQLVRPFRTLSVRDNVALALGAARTRSPLRALLSSDRRAEREEAGALLDLVGIADIADQLTSTLPLGFLKRVEMARALALAPKLLLLDEPLAGLNHAEAARLADTILMLNKQGLSILLIEHNLGEVTRICERLVVLDNGRLLAEGPTKDVLEDRQVRAAYLGSKADAAA